MDISVRLEIKNPEVQDAIEEVLSSIKGFSYRRSGGASDILILEIDEHFEFDLLRPLQSSAVFLTSEKVDPNLLILALRAGVKEFFSQPIHKEEVRNALLKFKEQRHEAKVPERTKGRIIDVLGSKGGVGTTTVAVNLASTLAEMGKQVALVDMNRLLGGIPVFLNMEVHFHWGEIIKDISRLDSAYLMSILSRHPSGLYVLPSPPELNGLSLDQISGTIDKLLTFMQGLFDFVIVDGGSHLDDTALKVLQVSDTVFLVASLSLPCLTNMKKLLWTFRKLGYPQDENTHVLVTRYTKKGLIQPKDAEQSISKMIYWSIPEDDSLVTSAINQGKTIAAVERNSETSRSFRELASDTIGRRRE